MIELADVALRKAYPDGTNPDQLLDVGSKLVWSDGL